MGKRYPYGQLYIKQGLEGAWNVYKSYGGTRSDQLLFSSMDKDKAEKFKEKYIP